MNGLSDRGSIPLSSILYLIIIPGYQTRDFFIVIVSAANDFVFTVYLKFNINFMICTTKALTNYILCNYC